MPKDRNLLELIDAYANIIEQQNHLIQELIDLTKHQAEEVQQYKELAGCEDFSQNSDLDNIISEASMLLEEEP